MIKQELNNYVTGRQFVHGHKGSRSHVLANKVIREEHKRRNLNSRVKKWEGQDLKVSRKQNMLVLAQRCPRKRKEEEREKASSRH